MRSGSPHLGAGKFGDSESKHKARGWTVNRAEKLGVGREIGLSPSTPMKSQFYSAGCPLTCLPNYPPASGPGARQPCNGKGNGGASLGRAAACRTRRCLAYVLLFPLSWRPGEISRSCGPSCCVVGGQCWPSQPLLPLYF